MPPPPPKKKRNKRIGIYVGTGRCKKNIYFMEHGTGGGWGWHQGVLVVGDPPPPQKKKVKQSMEHSKGPFLENCHKLEMYENICILEMWRLLAPLF